MKDDFVILQGITFKLQFKIYSNIDFLITSNNTLSTTFGNKTYAITGYLHSVLGLHLRLLAKLRTQI